MTSGRHAARWTAGAFALAAIQGVVEELAINSGSLPTKAFSSFLLLSAFSAIACAVFLAYPDCRRSLPSGVRIAVGVFIVYGVLQVARSLRLDFKTLTDLFATRGGVFLWLTPMALVVGTRLETWRCLKALALVLVVGGIPTMVVLLANYDPLGKVHLCKTAAIAGFYLAMFFVMTAVWLRWRDRLLGLAGMVLYAVASLVIVYRTMMITAALFAVLAILFWFVACGSWQRRYLFMVGLGVAALVSILGFKHFGDFIVPATPSIVQVFERVSDKGVTDTRSGIYEDLIAGLDIASMLLGRGHRGTYLSEAVMAEGDAWERSTFEGGWAWLLLKGGLVTVLLVVGLALPAALLGLFASRNVLVKAAASLILIRMLEMVPFGNPYFDPSWLLFWLAVGACYSRPLREFPGDLNPFGVDAAGFDHLGVGVAASPGQSIHPRPIREFHGIVPIGQSHTPVLRPLTAPDA